MGLLTSAMAGSSVQNDICQNVNYPPGVSKPCLSPIAPIWRLNGIGLTRKLASAPCALCVLASLHETHVSHKPVNWVMAT